MKNPHALPAVLVSLASFVIPIAFTTGSASAQGGGGRVFSLIVPEQQVRNAVAGVAYHHPLRVAGALGEIVAEPLSPLPGGMALELSGDRTGVALVGTPQVPGPFAFDLLVADARGRTGIGSIHGEVVLIDPDILAEPDADFDGDRVPNLAERRMGRSPYEAEPAPRVAVRPGDGGRPVFETPDAPGATEVRRVIEVWDPDLSGWRATAHGPALLTDGERLVANLHYGPREGVMVRQLFSVPKTKGEELADIIKKLNELREAVEEAEGDLEDNPLVQEVRLIELIRTLLENPSEITDLLEEWLEAELDELFPPLDDLSDDDIDDLVERINRDLDRIKKVLCYAKQLLDFLAKVERDPDEKAALESAAAQIERVKELIETSDDFGAMYDELRRGLEGLKDLIADKVEEFLADKLADFVKKQLIRRFGAGAASAILSAAVDAFNLIDALIAQGRLEEARALYNLMFFRMLELAYECGKYHIDCERWNTDENNPRVQFGDPCPAGKKVTVQACLRHWVQDPDGGPNEGHFEELPVAFEGGETTLEEDPFSSDVEDECAYAFRLAWEAFAAAAEGKEHVHLILKVRVDDGPVQPVFGGVYRP